MKYVLFSLLRGCYQQLPSGLKARFQHRLLRSPRLLNWRQQALALASLPLPQATPPAQGSRLEPSTPTAVFGTRLAGASDVFVFPVINWDFRIQRPQHMAMGMARKGARVFYFTVDFARGPNSGYEVVAEPEPNVYVVRLTLDVEPPVVYTSLPTPAIRDVFARALDVLREDAQCGQLVSIVDLPFWRCIAQSLPGNTLVYDCMDYHAGFGTNGEAMLQEEDALISEADLVITTSQRLHDLIAETRPNVLIRNGAEVAFFASKPERLMARGERPVIGYFGAISEWFDIGLVVSVAKALPDCDFVFVGSTFGCDVRAAEKLPNVRFLGEKPYAELPAFLHAFDVCLIPFLITELTRCTNPVKVYEYLAAGKPVVATPLPELEAIEAPVHIAADAPAFVTAICQGLAEQADQALSANRAAWAQANDWQSRTEALQAALMPLWPKASVIVLTYNNLEFTKACLWSLEQFTDYPNWELVIVDNNSSDGTQDFLRDYAARHGHVRLVLNAENQGFAAGNNRGLEVAGGDYLVLLNNDTFVTRGWLHDLVRHLSCNPRLGLVGPVTNNIGNEAKLDIEYADMGEMARRARDYTRRHPRELLPVRVVAFFCVALPTRVYREVGGLDEAFGIGFFEDDDYCNRVRAAGYEVAIADDVFVHHHLSASFNALAAERKRQLFETNKAIYEAKWGAWIPHRYRDA